MHSMCTVANAREDAVRRRHPTVAWTVEKERCLESREVCNDKPRECVPWAWEEDVPMGAVL